MGQLGKRSVEQGNPGHPPTPVPIAERPKYPTAPKFPVSQACFQSWPGLDDHPATSKAAIWPTGHPGTGIPGPPINLPATSTLVPYIPVNVKLTGLVVPGG